LAACSSASRSSSARPAAPVPVASPSVVPPATRGESGGPHCGHNGHVEAVCYKKEKAPKAQARRSSQGISGTNSGGYERSFAGSKTQEIVMLLCRLAISTSLGAASFVTQPSAPTGSATASQSSALGPPSAPSLGIDPWYLDFGTSFHMTPYSTHLSSLRPSCHHCTVHTIDGSPLSVAGQGTLCSDSFHVPDVSLVSDLTMQLMSAGQITDHDCRVIPDPNFLLYSGSSHRPSGWCWPRCRDSQRHWELD
jgi:hypothetical protein